VNDVEKACFNAALLDLVQWPDARIAQQVEHQLEQRLHGNASIGSVMWSI